MTPGDENGERALSVMLAGMEHELNNSLQALELNVEVVRLRGRREAPEAWETLERHLATIESNLDLLNRRLSVLFALAARSPASRPTGVSLERLLSDLMAAVHPKEGAFDLEIRSPAGTPEVEAREGYLLELLFRILRNPRARPAGDSAAGDGGSAKAASRIDVEEVSGRVELKIPMASAAAPAESEERRAWDALARRAGGRLSVDRATDTLVLDFPPAGDA